MFKKKRKSHVSLELHDYVLRALVAKGGFLEDLTPVEFALPVEIMDEGDIADEMALFDLIKEHVQSLGGKKQPVRFFAPNASVLLKQIEHPKDVKSEELQEYVRMEVGHSIHLPFQEPLVDVHDPVPDDGKAVIFAAPPDEVNKVTAILMNNDLVPSVVDIRALSNLRLLDYLKMIDAERTYLIADWSINSLVICIYSQGEVEFLRFQAIDTNIEDWVAEENENGELSFSYNGEMDGYKMLLTDQVLEIDRMMNFFRFSLHKGDKSVDEMIVLGDNPLLAEVHEILKDNFTMPIHAITDDVIANAFPGLKAKHSALIGLALKGVHV